MQYINVDESRGKNFGLLIIGELTRIGFTTCIDNSKKQNWWDKKSFHGYPTEWNMPSWKG